MMPAGDDTFTLYNLRVEVVADGRPMVCNHRPGELAVVPLGEG